MTRRDDFVFCVETEWFDPESERADQIFDALYPVGLGRSWHPVGKTELYFDFLDTSHPQPSDELSAEGFVRPTIERLGLTVRRWWREDSP
jgi:hypothetical protein